MKKKIDFMLIIMVICFAVVAVILVSKKDKETSKVDYEITIVKKKQIDTLTSIEGRVEIQNFQDVKISKVLKVKEINYKVGDQIKKGDVIATFTGYTTRKSKNGKSYRVGIIRRYTSPIDGYILNMNLELEKEIIDPAFTLVKAEDIKLYTGIIKEEDKRNIIPGVKVSVKFSDTERFDTEILKVEKINGSDDIRGELSIENIGLLLKNMNKSFEIEMTSQDKKEILVVPLKTIIKKQGTNGEIENYIYTIDSNNKVVEKKVDLGSQNGEVIEIKNGVKDGESIVLSPDDNLKTDTVIKVK